MDSEQFHHDKGSSIPTMNYNTNTSSNLNGPSANPSKSSFLCRQSSTRWIPTGEQVRILRDLYYNCGVRSPTADQIQKISARLRQYGKIEGKNVFYWFQNHKARERQKKRLTVDVPPTTKASSIISPGVPVACSSSPGLYDAGQMGSSSGSMLMDSSFRECWGGDGMVTENSMSWMGFETPVMAGPWMHQWQQEPAEMVAKREIETLPLFPVHAEEQEQQEEEGIHDGFGYGWKGYSSYFPGFYCGGDQQMEMEGVMTGYNHQPWSSSSAAAVGVMTGYNHQPWSSSGATSSAAATAAAAAASLELSLNSCYYGPPGST